jgi:uncharacterized membrane-anchored protein
MQGGQLWTDFAIQSDGFSRFVLRDVGMRAQQAGRLAPVDPGLAEAA